MRSNFFRTMLLALTAVCLALGVEQSRGQVYQLITVDTKWRYSHRNLDLGAGWRAPDYNDTVAGWQGPGSILFGYETTPAEYAPLTFKTSFADPLTEFPYVTNYYFRTHFTIPNVPSNVLALTALLSTNYIDDGCIYYLNGVELFRYNMPSGAVNAATWALGSLSEGYSATASQTIFIRTNFSASLVIGDNVLAVEVHNATNISSDEVFGMTLTAIVPLSLAITTQPRSQKVVVGSNVTFAVMASGTSPLSYQWRFNGTDVGGQTNSTLAISNGQPFNAGPYRVVVSNPAGSVTSVVATLSVGLPPIVTTQPQSQSVPAGANVTFNVVVSGSLPLYYEWRFNGSNLIGANYDRLIVGNAQLAKGGDYTVVITNSYGALTSSIAVLTVWYSLTLDITGSGAVTATPDQPSFPLGTTVRLLAVPGPGYGFVSWSGDASGAANPLEVTMTSNTFIVANFLLASLIITVQGEGTVSRSPDKVTYDFGEQITLNATARRWYAFNRWGDGITNNPRVITIEGGNNYEAFFYPTTALETLTFSDISRLAPVGMPSVFVDGAFVPTGTVTRITSAGIAIQSTFPKATVFYSLDGSQPSFASKWYTGPFTLRHSALLRALAFDANFTQSWEADPVQVIIQPTYSLAATADGGGDIVISPTNAAYLSHSLVTATATPSAGWTFLQWLGDGHGAGPTNPLVMDRDRCVQAVFGTILNTITSGKGSVSVDPVSGVYPYGHVVTLTAIPETGNYFAFWGNAATGTNNPLRFTMTNSNPTISCLFGPLSAGQFALTIIPDGSGQVAASPRANRYNNNHTVSLTAIPGPGDSFLSWSGDASGAQNPLVISMTQSRIITAHFTRRPLMAVGGCVAQANRSPFQLLLTGQMGGRFQIEQSLDLNAWMPLVILTNVYGTVQYNDPSLSNGGQRFYRAVPAPN